MANKKYTEFAAGTYDTSKIFLQADATTGALEKVFLPPLGGLPWISVFISITTSGIDFVQLLGANFSTSVSSADLSAGSFNLLITNMPIADITTFHAAYFAADSTHGDLVRWTPGEGLMEVQCMPRGSTTPAYFDGYFQVMFWFLPL